MSSRRRITRLLSPRTVVTALALTAIAAIGISVAVPESAAFAEMNTPLSRFEHSAAHGTLSEDLRVGKLSPADVDAVSHTGFEYQGQHVPAWGDLTDADRAEARTAPPVLTAGADARADASLTAPTVQAAPVAAPRMGSGITESKSVWSHIRDVIEFAKHDHWFYINGKWIQWMAGAGIGAVWTSWCGAIARSLPTMAFCSLAVVIAWAGMGLLHQSLCGRRGAWVDLPWVEKSHCNDDR
ncbi:hypothetical protein ACMT9Y_13105 [Clavibacter tessellarius]|uniref:hypothetical protein n=1 Tax=Clavibacter tessellarius TaxID=31965 RepID=UPI0039ED4482